MKVLTQRKTWREAGEEKLCIVVPTSEGLMKIRNILYKELSRVSGVHLVLKISNYKFVCFQVNFFFLVILWIEFRVSCLPGRCFTTWVTLPALFALVILEIGSHFMPLAGVDCNPPTCASPHSWGWQHMPLFEMEFFKLSAQADLKLWFFPLPPLK
jgi:hypothetical protein